MSSRAKSLVKKWKQLLPDSEPTGSSESTGHVCAPGLELRQGSEERLTTSGRLKEKPYTNSDGMSLQVPVIHIESADSEGSIVDLTDQMQTHSRKSRHGEKGRKKKRIAHHEESFSAHHEESFSEALEMPFMSSKVSSRSSCGGSGKHLEKMGRSRDGNSELDDAVVVRAAQSKEFDLAKRLGREGSPLASSLPQREGVSAGVKHKGRSDP